MKSKVIRPDFYDTFSCIGSKCKNTCCQKWTIVVKNEEFRKLKRLIQSDEMKEIFRDSFQLFSKEDSNIKFNQAKLYQMKLDENERCCFLDKEGLCRIYQECGAENMPDTCKIFPRKFDSLLGTLKVGLSSSCEEVVRLLLEEKDGIMLCDSERELEFDNISPRPASYYIAARPAISYYGDILTLFLGILQDRAYTMEERMILLGIVCKKLQEFEDNQQLEQIPQYTENMLQWLDKSTTHIELHKELSQFSPDPALRISYIFSYILAPNVFPEEMRNRVVHTTEITASKNSKETNKTVNSNKFKTVQKRFSKVFADKMYLIENVMVNYILNERIPFGYNMGFWESYCALAAMYSLFTTTLMCLVDEHTTEAQLIDDIVVISRNTFHSADLFKGMEQELKEANWQELANMAFLVL